MAHMFSTPGDDRPMGLWDPGKQTQQFAAQFEPTGGSMPEDGHAPFDSSYTRPTPGSPESFYGAPTQSDHFGGQTV